MWRSVRRIRTSLSLDSDAVPYSAKRPRHSVRAAARFSLKFGRLEWLRSVLKLFVTEAWTDANFCKLRIRRNRSIDLSLRRNGKCKFSARLFSQRPVSCQLPAPISPSAAPWVLSLSVTTNSGCPCFRMAFLRNYNAIFLSRVFVSKLSKTSPC